MKVILYTYSDGSCSVVRFQKEDGGYTSGMLKLIDDDMTPDEAALTIAKKHKKAAVSYRLIDATELPGGTDNNYDRTFYNAFKDTGKVEIDLVKAVEIAKEKIRESRKRVLVDLDLEYTKANEQSDTVEKAKVVERKQIARDATADIRLDAKNETDLKLAMETIISEVENL